MRKTLVYILILIVLCFGIYYFLFDNNNTNYDPAEAGFTVKDTASIGKIFFASNDGETILLERTDSGWTVNKKYKALKSTLDLVMTTLTKQAALYPVTKNAYDHAVKALSTDGVKVELYGRDGKKMKVFYVGGVAVNNTGTNMLIEGAKTPYVVQVQGFDGYLTSRYTTNLKDWRDRNIFSLPPDEIKTISVRYPDKPINSFVINREGNSITVKGDSNVTRHLDVLNMRRVNVYLRYFGNVNCEGYMNGIEGMDSTLNTSKIQSVIDVTGMHGQHQHVDIYWMALNKRSKNVTVSDPDVPDDYDADRLYAVINDDRDTVMIQQFVFKNMFRKAYEFYQKDDSSALKTTPREWPRNVMMHR